MKKLKKSKNDNLEYYKLHQILDLILHCFYDFAVVSVNVFYYGTQPFEGIVLLFHIYS